MKFFYDRPQLSHHLFKPINELNEIRLLRRIVTQYKIDCVFDVGANIGQYAQMLRRRVGFKGKIISFEPNPEIFAKLAKKASADSQWVVENIALSDTDGECDFHIMRRKEFCSLHRPSEKGTDKLSKYNTVEQTITVRTETLATAFPRLQAALGFQRPFLKMDTQGHDASIVRGGGAQMSKFLGLQSELSIVKLYEDTLDYVETIKFYESHGFRLCDFLANTRGHFPTLIEVDCLMLRSELMS